RRIPRNKPEKISQKQRVRRRQIMNPAKERRMTHFDGDINGLIKREEHRNLHKDRQAAGHRIELFLAVKLHHLLLETRLVILVPFLQRLHLGLHDLHPAKSLVGFVGEREESELDQYRKREDRK